MRQLFFLLFISITLYWVYHQYFGKKEMSSVEKLRLNYEKEIDQICKEMDLPPEYFKALVILESSAEKPAGSRYEEHVFQRLKDVRDGKAKNYGKFTQKQLRILSENTLRKLATSWGPIQIMGYHCIPMGITFEQLTGDSAMRYAIRWANQNYGAYLRRGDFSNAFHIHNTGHTLPPSGISDTHDPEYINKGMDYIYFFRKQNKQQNGE